MVFAIDAVLIETMSIESSKLKTFHYAFCYHVFDCLIIHMLEPLMSYVNALLCDNYTFSNKYTNKANYKL